MPVIPKSDFIGITDRIARQWQIHKQGIDDLTQKGGGLFYSRVHDSVGGGDPQVERDLVSPANRLDDDFDSGVTARQYYQDFINNLERHVVQTSAGISTLDQYLNISGINVSPYFEEVYFLTKGTHLDARNVFENPADTLMATVSFTGSSAATFTDGDPVGTGTGKVAENNHAASSLKAVPTATVGATDIILDVKLLEEDFPKGSTATSRQVTIPGTTAAGTQVAVGTAGEQFLDVTDIKVAGGNSGDGVKIVSTQERVEAL